MISVRSQDPGLPSSTVDAMPEPGDLIEDFSPLPGWPHLATRSADAVA